MVAAIPAATLREHNVIVPSCRPNARLQRRRALAGARLPGTCAPAVRCKPQFGGATPGLKHRSWLSHPN